MHVWYHLYVCVYIYMYTTPVCIYIDTHIHAHMLFKLYRFWYLFNNLTVFPEEFLVYKNKFSFIPSIIS